MTEATKRKWAWCTGTSFIDIFDPSGEHFLQFNVDDETRKVTEEKVAKLVLAMNMHDGLVAACRAAHEKTVCTIHCQDARTEGLRCHCGMLAVSKKLESALAGEAPTEPIAEPVELVVGDKYEILIATPDKWVGATCFKVQASKDDNVGGEFRYDDAPGDFLVTRFKGEYRYPVAKAAEVAG